MNYKQSFQVNQIWKSKDHPEKDFIVYSVYYKLQSDCSREFNDESCILTAIINETAFKNNIAKVFKTNTYDEIKRETIFPFSWFGEHKPNSLKQKIRKYNMYLAETLDYDVGNYNNYGGMGDKHEFIKDFDNIIKNIYY